MRHVAFRSALAVVAIVSSAACAAPQPDTSAHDAADLVIGSYPFTESRVLAHVYAAALEQAGWKVHVEQDISSRELMIPAVEQGKIDLVPEYEGTLHVFLSGIAPDDGTVNVDEHHLRTRRLVALEPAPAQNRNEIVVLRSTAIRLNLRKISDLEAWAGDLVLGGPPECPSRPLCLLGLGEVYGISFADFRPIDTGGPLTLAALRGGEIDVGVLFTTDPALADDDLVVLKDDLHLQPHENITPIMNAAVLAGLNPSLRIVIDEVSGRLSTEIVRELNRQVGVIGREPRDVANEWLHAGGS